MILRDILLGGSGLAIIILSLIQISPIRINPWSAFGRFIGRAINAVVLKEIEEVKKAQKEAREKLDEHIAVDDERNADGHRQRILQFNNELLRDIPHTREDFIEILAEIDFYERYCREHENYKNNRAVHAIANIERVYDERLKKHDFL
ncbi:MAG: hypothetical protein E7648_07055 [Ruminococcaceae bacterium]|nr:hypothetical protein [Oscillospiraceae bacterium]